jgi:hypothetical protein
VPAHGQSRVSKTNPSDAHHIALDGDRITLAPNLRRARGQASSTRARGITMMPIVLILSATAISLACVGAALFLLWHERKGWGWFLFVAFLVAASAPTVSYTTVDGEHHATVVTKP